MRQEEALWEMLNWLVHLCHGCSKGGDETSPPSESEWQECLGDAEELLEATKDGAEMGHLMDWLEEQRDELEHYLASDKAIYDMAANFQQGVSRGYKKILSHVREEHGYE